MLSIRPTSVASGVIFAIAVAGAATAQPSRPDLDRRDGACFYENPNYGGKSFCVRPGESLRAMPHDMKDHVSSLRTFGGAEVVLYRDESFKGKSVRFEGDVPDLRHTNWNDHVSSVRVEGERYGSRGDDRGGYYGSDDRSEAGASAMVRRAYQDVLGHEPDTPGMVYYRDRIIDDGWNEARVRQELRHSEEYKSRTSDESGVSGMTHARAETIVRHAYHSVLKRDPDSGSESYYVDRVLLDGWSQSDVEGDLRRARP